MEVPLLLHLLQCLHDELVAAGVTDKSSSSGTLSTGVWLWAQRPRRWFGRQLTVPDANTISLSGVQCQDVARLQGEEQMERARQAREESEALIATLARVLVTLLRRWAQQAASARSRNSAQGDESETTSREVLASLWRVMSCAIELSSSDDARNQLLEQLATSIVTLAPPIPGLILMR